jgi:Domain of unknown function (DUF4440)
MEINGQAGRKCKIKMKSFITILCLFFVVGAFAQITDEEKLITTVKEFHQALVKKNTISINQQTDKALSYGHSNGWIQTKADIIKDFERGYISYQSFKEDSIIVLMNDNMANVRFVADITATLGGNTIVNNYHLKVLEVWVKKGKRWVLFARQAVKG